MEENKMEVDEGTAIIPTFYDGYCEFCGMEVLAGQGVILNSCLHSYCQACLIMSIMNTETPVVPCLQAEKTGCGGVLLEFEIKSITTSLDLTDIYDQYVARSLNAAKKDDQRFYNCAGKGCNGMCFVDDTSLQNFNCPLCKELNCLQCRAIHPGLTCEQFRQEEIVKPSNDNNKKGHKRKVSEGKEDDEAQAQKPKIAGLTGSTSSDDWNKVWTNMCLNYQRLQANVEGSTVSHATTGSQGDDCTSVMIPSYKFECSICLTDITPGDGIALLECYHAFCKVCLVSTIEHSEHPRVQCPFVGEFSCSFHLQDREIRAICPPEILNVYLKRFVTQAEIEMKDSFHCCTHNCDNWCIVEEGADRLRCSLCHKINCLKCKTIHEGVTCIQYKAQLNIGKADQQSEATMKKLIKEGKAMVCPQCGILIIKNGGCDGLACRVCKTQICWATKGFRWGPKGNGDSSAGCKCRSKALKGKRCSPNCHNCH